MPTPATTHAFANMRKTFTTATIPYFFQRTAAPNAGPQLSCWDPKGCRTR